MLHSYKDAWLPLIDQSQSLTLNSRLSFRHSI